MLTTTRVLFRRPLTLIASAAACCAFLLCGLVTPPLLAQTEADKDEIKYPVDMIEYHFAVQDENQKPVEGAAVTIRGLRCEEDPGSWYGWPTGNAGPEQKLRTDVSGYVKLLYPVKFNSPINWKTTTTICLSISHPDYVFEDIELGVDGKQPDGVEPAEVQTLKQGCHVSFTAKDADDQPIKKFAVLMAGAGSSAEWKTTEGVVESRGVPDGSWQTMLVSVDNDGQPLFSGVLPARYAKGKSFSIKNVELRRGLQVTGKLSGAVPRPISNGVVVAFSVPKPQEAPNGWETDVSWNDFCQIAEDGSFHFSSLPTTGDLQFIALCDGWVSKDVGWENMQTWTVQGLHHPLTAEETEAGEVQLELEMEPTGSVEVTVLGEDELPVAGIQVYSWPNQVYHRFGSTILGSHYRTLDALLYTMAPEQYPEPEWPRTNRFTATTNEAGVAIIRDIPLKRRESLMAMNDTYATADRIGFQCETADETVKVTVKVAKIEKTDAAGKQ